MAGYTPVSEVNLPMHNDDSGYFSCPPDSVASLDSEPCSNKKLSYGYNCRNYATSTPHTLPFSTPEMYCRGAHRALSHKRKASSGRFNLLQRSASVSSSLRLNKSSRTDSDLQSKGELSLGNDFVGLSLLDNTFDLQDNCKLDDSAIWCDEADVNENGSGKTKAKNEVDNMEQKFNKDEQVKCCHQIYMPTAHETCMQDGEIGSQETDNLYHLHHRNLPIEDCNLITNKLTKLTRKCLLEDPWKKCQTSEDFTQPSMQFSLKYSSQQLPCSNGQEKVDFLSLLGEQNDYSVIVKGILSYLEPVDLIAVALVSKTWNTICTSDSDASRRIHCYVEHKRRNKENGGSLQVNKLVSTPAHNRPRIHLRQIQNVGNEGGRQTVHSPPSPPPSPSKRRFLQFYKAGQQLENGKTLAPCPRCSLPSQIDGVSNVGQCTHKTCQYLFCCICHCESHNGSSCPFLVSFPRFRKRPSSICSKESKKNLRRL